MTERIASWARRNAALLTLILMVTTQFGATVWWTAVLSQRISTLEEKVSKSQPLIDQIPSMTQMDQQMLKLLDKISCDLNKLNDRLWQHHVETSGAKK